MFVLPVSADISGSRIDHFLEGNFKNKTINIACFLLLFPGGCIRFTLPVWQQTRALDSWISLPWRTFWRTVVFLFLSLTSTLSMLAYYFAETERNLNETFKIIFILAADVNGCNFCWYQQVVKFKYLFN